MATDLIDFAALDTTAAATETPTTEVETPSTESTVDSTIVENSDPTLNEDGTEQTPEQKTEADKATAAKLESDKSIDTKATPDNVRKGLKAFRDADPAKNGAIVKELHGAYERFNAYKTEFPTVAAAKEAKAFIETIGGPEGYEKLNSSVEAIKATDELLYSADPTLWTNVIEDLKSAGHIEAFGQLAPSFLENLKEVDSKAYYAAIQPHFVAGLNEVGFPRFLANLNEALEAKDETGASKPNIEALKAWVKQSSDWFKEQDDAEKARTKVPEDTPERKKFLAEKAEFEKTKTADTEAKVKQFEEGVATDAEHYNNRTLGKALAPFLKMPFFKDFPRETMVDLGNGIKDRLYSTLKADKDYQRQMAAMWKGGNTPANKANIATYHNAKLDSIAQDIVTKTIQNRYPGYAKGGSAAGRVAASTEKKAADVKAGVQSVASGKPIYVATRPTNLIRDAIKVGDREYSASDLVTMQIMGKGFVKSTDGKSYRLITWRR
jgi:hypothetical protein